MLADIQQVNTTHFPARMATSSSQGIVCSNGGTMKRTVFLVLVASLFAVPAVFAQALSGDHVEVGVFADYFGLERTSPHKNLLGLGARAAFNLRPNWQLEGEMNYDFKRNFTSTFSDGVNTQ